MRLSLPINTTTIINLPRPPLLLIPLSRYRKPIRFSTVALRGVSPPSLCRCWFSTLKAAMTTTTVGGKGEEKQSKLSVELKEKIDLNEKEREIFDRLLGTIRFCNLDTQLRVAGGWVRDKVTLPSRRRVGFDKFRESPVVVALGRFAIECYLK